MLICELSFLQLPIWKLLGQGKKWGEKDRERRKMRRRRRRGGQRCKWIYSSDHRHRENKQSQLKHFLFRWAGEGSRLQYGQTLWTSARLLCFTVWDTASMATAKLSRFLWALQKDPSHPSKKNMMHFIIRALSQPTCLFSSCLTWETLWEAFDGSPEFRKKCCCIYCLRPDSEKFGLCKTNLKMSAQQHLF